MADERNAEILGIDPRDLVYNGASELYIVKARGEWPLGLHVSESHALHNIRRKIDDQRRHWGADAVHEVFAWQVESITLKRLEFIERTTAAHLRVVED